MTEKDLTQRAQSKEAQRSRRIGSWAGEGELIVSCGLQLQPALRQSYTGVPYRKGNRIEWGKMMCEMEIRGLNGWVRAKETISTYLGENRLRENEAPVAFTPSRGHTCCNRKFVVSNSRTEYDAGNHGSNPNDHPSKLQFIQELLCTGSYF
jgi:hypothetical protein